MVDGSKLGLRFLLGIRRTGVLRGVRAGLAALTFVALVPRDGGAATQGEPSQGAPSSASAGKGSEAPPAVGDSPVVLRVAGESMTVRQIEQRLQGLSPWQRQQFGARPDEIRRRFVDEVLVPEMLLVAGAKARHLADAPHETAIQMIRVLSGASLRNVRQPLEAAEVSKDEAQTFYQDNLSKFQQPERIGIWRILCKTQETARSVIEAASKELTTAKFQELAREHSLDKATMYRGGNLGFVTAEGLSTEAGIKVDNTVVSAALGVKDGELVMKPVSEGENFAVVFRRGTVPASKRTLAEALPQIRETLRRRKIESAERAFLAGLREKHLREVHPELVDAIELKVDDTPVVQKGTPASSAPVPSRP